MLVVHGKERLRELLHDQEIGQAIIAPEQAAMWSRLVLDLKTGLGGKLAYLATYGEADVSVRISPDSRDPYISVGWYRGTSNDPWMVGALVRHSDGTWSVHT